MIKVLVAEENVAEANKYCRYLSKCRDLKIKTVNSGDQALSTYLKIKPNIFILDSHFNDINSTEIIDRLSITYNEGNNSNILLTANSAEEQVTFVNVSKIYKFFKKPVKLRNLYNTISQMNEKYKYDDFDENEMNVLLRELGFVINSPCTDLMIEAITECYHSSVIDLTVNNKRVDHIVRFRNQIGISNRRRLKFFYIFAVLYGCVSLF